MTKQTEALRMAIEWLDNQQLGYSGHSVRKACQEALAETQEPMIIKQDNGMVLKLGYDELPNGTAFYTTPSREWKSLSDAEIEELYGDCSIEYFRDIEAKLREKNEK